MNDDSYEKRAEMERLMMEDMLAKQRAFERGGMRWDSPDVKFPNNIIAHIVNDPIKVSPYNETRVSTGQAVKSITEEHQAHVATHKSIIDRYYAEKQVEVLKDREQAEYARKMEETLEASGWYTDQNTSQHSMPIASSIISATDNPVSAGYVQEVRPTPLIDNYEAYKLIEVLTEILAEIRSINRKLRKKVKK